MIRKLILSAVSLDLFAYLFGGATALHVAVEMEEAHEPFLAVFLSCTFPSVPDVYHVLKAKIPGLSWILAPDDLIIQHFAAIGEIGRLRAPLMMIQGDHDLMVPEAMSRDLFQAAEQVSFKRWCLIRGGNHDNLFYIASEPIREALSQFLQEMPSSSI